MFQSYSPKDILLSVCPALTDQTVIFQVHSQYKLKSKQYM